MKNRLCAAFLVAASVLFAPAAEASVFTLDSYTVTLRDHDPGLVLWRQINTPGAVFGLDEASDPFSLSLFTLGTAERALNLDDLKPYGISVDFNFSQPDVFSGRAVGITGAAWFGSSFGYVLWDNPLTLGFGDGGLLSIALTNAAFPLPGSANISGSFDLIRESASGGPTPAPVPEPATLLLLGTGLAAAAVRRRKAA